MKRSMKNVPRNVSNVILLSGTPAPNSLQDLWSQLFLLDRGQRLEKAFYIFRTKYFTPDFMGYNWDLKAGADQIIQDKVKDICMSLQTVDYLQLPDYCKNEIKITLEPKHLETYRALERDFLIQVEDETVTAVNSAVLSSKCLQLCNGAVYDENKEWHHIHDLKLDALEDIIEEAAGNPVLVAYNYQSDLERLKERFKKAVVLDKDPGVVDAWNRKEIDILLAHPASAGMGLNLQHGGNIIVWFGLTWSLENYLQFNARLYRQGQEKPVFVHHLVIDGTLESDLLRRLDTKESVQSVLMAALKRHEA